MDARLASGVKLQEVFNTPVRSPTHGTVIKKVWIAENLSIDLFERVEMVSKRHRGAKFLMPDGYAYLTIQRDGQSKHPKISLIRKHDARRLDADQDNSSEQRIYKGDTLMDVASGIRYLVVQIKSESGGKLVLIPITESGGVEELTKRRGVVIKKSGAGLLKLEAWDGGKQNSHPGGEPETKP
jgi:hypothetical protein